MRNKLLLLLLLFLLLPGSSVASGAPQTSGFIENLPVLVADAKRPDAMNYTAPGRSLKGFSKVAFEPVLVWYAPDSKYRGIEPDELAAVTRGMQDALIGNLEPKYPLVKATGADVLQIRIAITNVTAEKRKKKLLGYTPIGFVVGAAKGLATAGPDIELRSARVEAEILDGSGERLAVVIEPLVDGTSSREKLTWAEIAEVLDAYGKRMRARLDADNP
ncbi:MAG: DUF3313 domain-containing protein [Xanthomonadaceae bacterium]|jgi:hypothetical protein|nr:DUF3313 domain-containing protein [Xanthomonadaceae bacterium]